ncbi:hypothetical protein ANN_24494 [Periplaneta americana]|uniref:Uncharacterized protein n=1 Tax=Periplaneta americana TaxID=6978 RepID=A0ABQ8S387_PERAM|nr:hypothetical protein ANN_24494 [Periplaneta americana]
MVLQFKTHEETYTDVNEAGKNNKESIEEARERIKEGQLDRALDITNNLIKSACQSAQITRAQPWFDRTCYEERKETLRALVKAKTSKNPEDLTRYAEKRKQYKDTIKVKKDNYVEKKAQQMIEEAEKYPFWALKRKPRGVVKEIPIQNWQNHFVQILNKGNRAEAYEASTPKTRKQGTGEWKSRRTKSPKGSEKPKIE